MKCLTVLMQVSVQGADHPSRIAGILSQHGIDSPGLDSWAYAEAMSRAGR